MNEIETALSNISKASGLLSHAKTLEQTLEVRDRATAIAAYARARGADEAHSLALELKLRAERKAGGFLKKSPKNMGELLRGNMMLPRENTPTLKDLGIQKQEWWKRSRHNGFERKTATTKLANGKSYTTVNYYVPLSVLADAVPDVYYPESTPES